ncbi:MAG: hypothetical protein J07HB67_00616 [halophilic archaeon J07HB67]|nr:MAG: hypothetical protein J07HB67_00616 [halophilic archaeon J07HB67]
MQTLRVKLTVPETDPPPGARATFEQAADRHEDQAVFQVNRTAYVDREGWGFRISYRSDGAFVQTTSLRELEATMAAVAPHTFEQRVATGDE